MASDPRPEDQDDLSALSQAGSLNQSGPSPAQVPESAPSTSLAASAEATDDEGFFDEAKNEPAMPGPPLLAEGEKKSIKRKQEDTKSTLAIILTAIVGLVMAGGWWGWMQGKDLQEYATFTVPLFTLAAAALAFYDRGQRK